MSLESSEDRKERRRRAREAARDKALAQTGRTTPQVIGSSPRTITIHSHAELGEGPPEMEVPLQLQYTGSRVISSSFASIACDSLGLSEMLKELNDILGTAHTLEIPAWRQRLHACIESQYDFGMAYAHLRPRWYHSDPTKALEELTACEEEDVSLRASALNTERNLIIQPHVPPRRVWDLFSNRVVPSWTITGRIAAISHSWMSPELRHEVVTPINSREWPVPIPINTALERIRIELLNYGLEYVWLDVLCLRQVGAPEKESVRLGEWKLDVPTIGNVYHQNQTIVHYYSGLGRPFRIGDLASDRHWLNRAWTLQEISVDSIIAGIASESPINPAVHEETGIYVDPEVGKFYDSLASFAEFSQEVDNVFPVLVAMRHRAAVNELDKIAGLAYLLRSPALPAYIPTQSPEDAWRRLIETMQARYRGDLLFLYPHPGDGRYVWCPSWRQVKETTLPKRVFLFEAVQYDEENGVYRHRGYRLERCFLKGLAEIGGETLSPRTGRIVVMEASNMHEFPVVALHTQCIPEDYYTLIGNQGHECWVVGRADNLGRVEKVTVIRMIVSGGDALKRLGALDPGRWENVEYN